MIGEHSAKSNRKQAFNVHRTPFLEALDARVLPQSIDGGTGKINVPRPQRFAACAPSRPHGSDVVQMGEINFRPRIRLFDLSA